VVNNGDVLIVKSRFDAETAGTYAAVALVGRAVFFCTWAVVTTLFPAAARKDATGDPDPDLLRRAVAVTATASAVLTAAAWTVGPRVLELAFGAEYAEVGHLLGPYALATSLFALVNLLATHDLSLGRRRGPVVLAIGGAVQSVLVLLAGTTPDRVVWAQVLAMAGLLLATAALRRPAPATASDPAPPRVRQTTDMELIPAAAP
jgi:O-antigen/teichoic acid export membrane protein